jgi:hypothetical protein
MFACTYVCMYVMDGCMDGRMYVQVLLFLRWGSRVVAHVVVDGQVRSASCGDAPV